MTDPTTGSKLVTINTSAGEKQLKKLAPADWAKLGNIFRSGRKASLQGELMAAKTPPEETKKALDEFDRRPVRYRDVEAYVNTLEGQYAAILLSLQKDNPQAGEDEFNALDLQPDQWLGITAELLNLKLVTPPLPESGGSKPSDPPQSADPQSETGTPTPTESAST